MDRLGRILNAAANVAILGMAVVVAILLYSRFADSHQHARRAWSTPPPAIGTKVDIRLSATKAPPQLVVALSSNCGFCTASFPALRQLLEREPRKSVVFVFAAADSKAEAYLASSGIRGAGGFIWKGDFRSMGIRATPTVLILDRDQRIVRFWEGKVDSSRAAEILAAVRKAGVS